MTTQPSSSGSRSQSASIFDGYGVPTRYVDHSVSAPIEPINNAWQKVQSSFGNFGQWLLAAATGSSDPIVRQRRDRHGQTYYTIYDPISQRRTTCASETEVRAWLDQRYYP